MNISEGVRVHWEVNKHGRPTKYEEDMPESVLEYGNDGFLLMGDVIPTQEGLQEWLGIDDTTIVQYRKKYPMFKAAVSVALAKQSRILQNKGISGEFNSGMTKFLLSANHGKNERSEIDHSSSDGSLAPATFKGVSKSDES